MIEECPREADVVEAAARGLWSDSRSAELAEHIRSCPVCRDVADVSEAIQRECDQARHDARLPSAGLVWWRAQLRVRQERAAAAGRPITVAQAAAVAVAALFLFTLGGLLWPSLRASVTWIDELSQAVDMGRFWWPAVLTVGASLILAPVVLLVVLSDD
jgi:hypothetical protein